MAIQSLIKIKPKDFKKGDIVQVSLMAMHPMETGLRKDKETGKLVPANYINSVKFLANGKEFTSMNIWESLSVNPVFTINYKVTGPTEIKAIFTDNQGVSNEKSMKLEPQG
jgi:sulfur-oxidizing protein SoxZ